jgi:hypothetical protein
MARGSFARKIGVGCEDWSQNGRIRFSLLDELQVNEVLTRTPSIYDSRVTLRIDRLCFFF